MNASAPDTRGPQTGRLLISGAAAILLICAVLWMGMRSPSTPISGNTVSSDANYAKDREFRTELGVARRAAERQDFQKALQSCDAALQIAPDSIEALLLKADLLFRLHRPNEMRAPLERVLKLDHKHFEAHIMLAHALRLSGELNEAEQHVLWCLNQRPDFPPARRMRAEIARDGGSPEIALKEIRLAIAEGNTELDSYLLLAELLMYQRQFQEAYDALAPHAESFTTNHRFAAAMARLCQVLNRTDEANHYRAVLEQLKSGTPVE